MWHIPSACGARISHGRRRGGQRRGTLLTALRPYLYWGVAHITCRPRDAATREPEAERAQRRADVLALERLVEVDLEESVLDVLLVHFYAESPWCMPKNESDERPTRGRAGRWRAGGTRGTRSRRSCRRRVVLVEGSGSSSAVLSTVTAEPLCLKVNAPKMNGDAHGIDRRPLPKGLPPLSALDPPLSALDPPTVRIRHQPFS